MKERSRFYLSHCLNRTSDLTQDEEAQSDQLLERVQGSEPLPDSWTDRQSQRPLLRGGIAGVLWDEIGASNEPIVLHPWQFDEATRRSEQLNADPSKAIDRDELWRRVNG